MNGRTPLITLTPILGFVLAFLMLGGSLFGLVGVVISPVQDGEKDIAGTTAVDMDTDPDELDSTYEVDLTTRAAINMDTGSTTFGTEDNMNGDWYSSSQDYSGAPSDLFVYVPSGCSYFYFYLDPRSTSDRARVNLYQPSGSLQMTKTATTGGASVMVYDTTSPATGFWHISAYDPYDSDWASNCYIRVRLGNCNGIPSTQQTKSWNAGYNYGADFVFFPVNSLSYFTYGMYTYYSGDDRAIYNPSSTRVAYTYSHSGWYSGTVNSPANGIWMMSMADDTSSSSNRWSVRFQGFQNNFAPTLAKGSVSPSSGSTSTTFTYQVIYTDKDNNPASTRYVYIDGSARTMSYVSGAYSTGATYRYTTTLSAGTHNYYFYFTDGSYKVRLPASSTYSGPSVTSPPSLSLVGSATTSCTPGSGFKGTNFYFNITYTDPDGDAALTHLVYVNGTSYTMSKVSGAPAKGEIWSAVLTGATLGVGPHAHYFDFRSMDGKALYPTSGTVGLPTVFPNTRPYLLGPRVTPLFGATTTMFTYEVTYRDANSDPPSSGYPKVMIDGSTTLSMTYVSGNAFSGSLYRATTSSLSTGTHNYRFNASDGSDWASGDGLQNGPTVNPPTAPTLTGGKVNPVTGTIADTYTFSVMYTDSNNDPPTTVRLHIDTDSVGLAMSVHIGEDNVFWNGENYTLTLSGSLIGSGTHTFYFSAQDGTGTGVGYDPATAPSAYYSFDCGTPSSGGGGGGSYVNLTNSIIISDHGSVSDIFQYLVTYTSATPPMMPGTTMAQNPVLHIDGLLGYEMLESNPADTIFNDGKDYYIKVSGSAVAATGVANHYFYFTASDGTNINKTSVQFGPNFDPVLSGGCVTPASGGISSSFDMSVIFLDQEGMAPDLVELVVDGTHYAMSSTDTGYSTGATYTYHFPDASTLGEGIHDYYFLCRDSSPHSSLPNGTARLPKVGSSTFTVISGFLPDLRIASGDISFSKIAGSTYSIKATVHNIGSGAVPVSNTFNVSFYYRDPDSGGVFITGRDVPGSLLGPGDSTDVVVTHTFTAFPTSSGVGAFEIYVVIERPNPITNLLGPNSIEELVTYHGGNNKATRTLRMGPDLTVTSGDISPNSLMFGGLKDQPLKMVITVRNIGPDSAAISNVRLLIYNDGTNALLATCSDISLGFSPTLLSGGAVKVVVPIPASSLSGIVAPGDTLAVRVEVDDTNLVGEIIEHADTPTNNKAVSSIDIIDDPNTTPSFAPATGVVLAMLVIFAAAPAVKNRIRERRRR